MSGNYFRGGRGRGQNWGRFGRGSPRGRGNWNTYRGAYDGGGFRGRPGQNFGWSGQNSGNIERKWHPNLTFRPQKGPKRERYDIPSKRLSEEQIGVTEFVSDHEGFLGIIKSRYSDFQVSEINERGAVAVLTELEPPERPAVEVVDEDEDLLSKYDVNILPMDTWNHINKVAMTKDSEDKVEVDVTGMSKEQRTKIHEAVKRAFGQLIVGSTVQGDGTKMVRFERFRKGIRIDKRVKWQWGGEYVHFIVHKENVDTMEAAQKLAERLRINLKSTMFGYAGTKDRRAKTSQWFSLRKVDPQKIFNAAQGMRELHVGNYSFSQTHLKLGMLQGNRFQIALRNVTAPDELVDEACRRLKERGFINYYGLQRFGTCVEMPTYQIGLKLLQKNFQEALSCILLERKGPLQHALHVYATAGAAAALAVWPPQAWGAVERRVVQSLHDNPKDLLGAINRLARNTRLLYLHSYQSLIWNRCASERLKRFGLKPAVGDLVPQDTVTEEFVPETIEEADDTEDETNQDGGDDKIADDKIADDKMEDENMADDKMADDKMEDTKMADDKVADIDKDSLPKALPEKEPQYKIRVKILTEEDIESGKYTIFDIVLPLPGFMIEYPPNMKDYYDMLLAQDGVKMSQDKKHKSLSMSGAYRHLVVSPGNTEWRCVRYNEPYADLIASDWDKMQGREINGIVEDGKYKALLITMDLRASCYATMALRELLKVDTACDNQALQNNYHKKKDENERGENKSETGENKSESVENKSESGEIKSEVEENKSEIEENRSQSGENIGLTGENKSESGEVDQNVEKVSESKEEVSQNGEKRKADDESDDVDLKKFKQE